MSGQLERASVLFNVAALEGHAAAKRTTETDDGLRAAAVLFQAHSSFILSFCTIEVPLVP